MGKMAIKRSITKQRASRRKLQPEHVIVKLAQEGKLAVIGEKAMADSFRLGLPVTRLEGAEIVKIYADGRREVVKVLPHVEKAL